ncbi:MAG: CHAT domain-containing protein, partial [Planctomycetota bacterium]
MALSLLTVIRFTAMFSRVAITVVAIGSGVFAAVPDKAQFLPETIHAMNLVEKAADDPELVPLARKAAETALTKVVQSRSRVCELRGSLHRRHANAPMFAAGDALLNSAHECFLAAKTHAHASLRLESSAERVEAMRLAWCGFSSHGDAAMADAAAERTHVELLGWTAAIGRGDAGKVREAIKPHASLVFDILLGRAIQRDNSRNYAEALKSIRLAKLFARQYLPNEKRAMVLCGDSEGLILINLGQYSSALKSFRDSLEYAIETRPTDLFKIADCRIKIIQTLLRLQDLAALRDETPKLVKELAAIANGQQRVPSLELLAYSKVIESCLATESKQEPWGEFSCGQIDALARLIAKEEIGFDERLGLVAGFLAIAKWKASRQKIESSKQAIDAAELHLQAVHKGNARKDTGDALLADYDYGLGLACAAIGKHDAAAAHFDRHRRLEWPRNIDRLVCLPLYDQYLVNAIDIAPRMNAAINLAWDSPNDQRIVELTATWLINGRQLLGTTVEKQLDLIRAEMGEIARNVNDKKAIENAPLVAPAEAALAVQPINNPAIMARQQDQELQPAIDPQKLGLVSRSSSESAVISKESRERLQTEQWRFMEGLQAWKAAVSWRGEDAVDDHRWLELTPIRERLSEGDVLVLYSRVERIRWTSGKPIAGGARYGAWVIYPNRIAGSPALRFVDLGTATAIDQGVKDWQQEIVRFYSEGDSEPESKQRAQAKLKALSDLILAPLHLKGTGNAIKRILFLPDSVLWMAPFAALPFQGKEFLVETVESVLLRNAQYLVPVHEDNVTPSASVMFGDPDFELVPQLAGGVGGGKPKAAEKEFAAPPTSEVMKNKFNPLRNGQYDTEVISAALKKIDGDNAVILTGGAASEAALRSIERPYIAVVSSHGYYLPGKAANGNPDQLVGQQLELAANGDLSQHPWMRSGFALAGFNRLDRAGGNGGQLPLAWNDGNVTAYDVMRLDLHGTHLVVLAACSTGVGDTQTGESVAGLWQAFHVAGVGEVVATLWDIPDTKLTSDFIATFLDGYNQTQSATSALR